jgi:hypothetical protein
MPNADFRNLLSIRNPEFRNPQSKGPGREADRASANSTLPDSHRSAGMSHAPKKVSSKQ